MDILIVYLYWNNEIYFIKHIHFLTKIKKQTNRMRIYLYLLSSQIN